MPPYRAGAGSGLFGSHVQPDSRPQIDIGSALDAMTNGASSLIHQAYLRKRQDREDQMQREQIVYQRNRDTIGDQRYEQERQQKQEQGNREFELKAETQRRNDLINGLVPASTKFDTTPNQTDVSAGLTPTQPSLSPGRSSPIASAMTAPALTAQQPQQPGSPAASASRVTTVPESYDPTRAAGYVRAQALGEGRAQAQLEHDQRTAAASMAGRQFAANASQALARLRASLGTGKGGSIHKAMTAGQQHSMNVAIAAGFLQQHGGYSQEALETFRNTPEGKKLQSDGITENDLLAGSLKTKADPDVAKILGLVNSFAVDTPTEGAAKLAEAETAAKARKGAGAPAAAAPSAGAKSPSGNIDLSKPSTPAAKLGAKPAASAKSKVPPPQTQDEYDFLISSGMTDAQIQQRYGAPAASIKRKK